MKAILLLYTFVLTVLSTVLAHGADVSETDCYSTKWPHELSSLDPDPSLHFGRLKNGFRYILKTNREPRDRVGVYLNVETGSVYEQESERGLAHFLEHLLFNGTTHFKPGELIDYFQSIGMSFGGDVNAYTSYTDTVYKLILPTGTSESLDKALLVMRDYADGALLLEEEIDRERGIILAERTARNSAAYNSRIARMSFIMENTLIPERQPIGIEPVIKYADRDDFVAFYQKWYRPDNMVLVMVGDFVIEDATQAIENHFASMTAEMEGACPAIGQTSHQGIETFYHYEPEIGNSEVFIETIRNKAPENDSIELQIRNLHRLMGAMMINHRLQRLQESPDTPFTSAGYYDSALLDRIQVSGIRARSKKENWRESLAEIDRVLKQALRYGFYDQELERVKKQLQVDFENRVLGMDTRNSLHIINQILANLSRNRVFQSPMQEQELYGPLIEQITIDDLNASLKAVWQDGNRIVQVVGDADLAVDAERNELKTYYMSLADRTIKPPEKQSEIIYPYLAFPDEAVEPAKVTDYPDIGARRIDFKNGLIVNLKKTRFKENRIRAALHFGSGRTSVPAQGLDLLAASLVNGSGTATLTKSQLDEALSGSSVHVRFRVGAESFVITGSAVSSDAELLIQTLYTMLHDPGFRPDEYTVAMKNFDSMYRRLGQEVGGAERLHLNEFFTGNAIGVGLPGWAQFREYLRSDVVEWLTPYFSDAPLELSIVGDIDEAEMTSLAGRYFGSGKKRTYTIMPETKAVFPAGREYEVVVDSTIDKALVKYGWLTTDSSDNSRSRRLHVLAAVLEDRLRRKMREELGKTYSPSAYSVTSRIYPGFGAIYAKVLVDQATIGIARDVLAEIGDSFALQPINSAEVERAREPIVTSLKDTARTNGYWLNSVLSLSSRHKRQLEYPTTLVSDFESITVEQVNDLAQTYITNDRRAVAVARPVESKSGGND